MDLTGRWTEKTRQAWMNAAPIPPGCVPPYYCIGPYDTVLEEHMTEIGWLKSNRLGPFVAPDGNLVHVIHSRAIIEQAEATHARRNRPDLPIGTVFVLIGNNNFMRAHRKILESLISDSRWIKEELPKR